MTGERVFLAAWGAAWVVVGIGALRSMAALARIADEAEPEREAVNQAARRTRRWACAMVGMGAVMAVMSPWL